jgi:hypothetical protein
MAPSALAGGLIGVEYTNDIITFGNCQSLFIILF